MAKASLELIRVLRAASRKIAVSTQYQWGHMGACNCGFLAQEVTRRSKDEIHRDAMIRYGEWSEQLNDYCPTSGLPMDTTISELLAFGFEVNDLKNLEYLSSHEILQSLPTGENYLRFNVKSDVVRYFNAWAELLEEELLKNITLPNMQTAAMTLEIDIPGTAPASKS